MYIWRAKYNFLKAGSAHTTPCTAHSLWEYLLYAEVRNDTAIENILIHGCFFQPERAIISYLITFIHGIRSDNSIVTELLKE